MNRLGKSNTPPVSHVSKVVISAQPDSQEMDGALQQLKQGKKLYVRLNSEGATILTTKAPRWYTFKAQREQKAAQSVLLAVLTTSTVDPNTNRGALAAAATLSTGVRNTDAIRDAVSDLAGHAKAMSARGWAGQDRRGTGVA